MKFTEVKNIRKIKKHTKNKKRKKRCKIKTYKQNTKICNIYTKIIDKNENIW